MFETLHDNANSKEYFIDVTGNPGAEKCNKEIAILKGWTVITGYP
jgi:hypothetical protein